MLAESRCAIVCVPIFFYIALALIVFRLTIPLKSKESSFVHEELVVKGIQAKGSVLNIENIDKSVPPIQLLTKIFHEVDANQNNALSVAELTEYIHRKTKEHIDQATKENYGLFAAIDVSPQNGVISWNEYHSYFLIQHGFDENYIKSHNEKHAGLGRSLKEMIARDRASWSEAARSDPEFLTVNEFLAFRHPESSYSTILSLVDDLLDKLDRDGDETLTEDEFALLQVSDGEKIVSQGEKERRYEFKTLIDANGDGIADKNELLSYIDPRNPRHAKEEAETLVTLSDNDHNGQLSLSEILSKMDLFLGSKMVDTAKSFHDEF